MSKKKKPEYRTIRLIGDVDHALYENFTEELEVYESESSAPVDIELCSDGGDACIGLAFYSRIRKSTVDIRVHAIGRVASAATIILAAGDYRTMDEVAWVMIHEEQLDGEDVKGSTRTAHALTTNFVAMEDQWNNILEKRTGTSASRWLELHRYETYLTAAQCKELGLVDEVV